MDEKPVLALFTRNNESGFEIYRSLDSEDDYELMFITDQDTVSYYDFDVDPLTTYYYKVRARNSEIFSDYSNVVTTSTPVGIFEEELISTKHKVYPNPTSGNINIQINDKYTGIVYIEIYSLSGELIVNKNSKKSDIEFLESINLTELSEGAYILNVRSDKGDLINDLIVKN